jgi:hypothetical protein
MMTPTQLERLESLKIGLVGGCSVAVISILLALIHSLTPLRLSPVLLQGITEDALISGAIAFISGFLFGVTYRYVVRAAPNPQLKSGAVLAFGLVRGLAQLDLGWRLQEDIWLLLLLAGESVVMFAIAALPLNLLIKGDAIARPPSDNVPLAQKAEVGQ